MKNVLLLLTIFGFLVGCENQGLQSIGMNSLDRAPNGIENGNNIGNGENGQSDNGEQIGGVPSPQPQQPTAPSTITVKASNAKWCANMSGERGESFVYNFSNRDKDLKNLSYGIVSVSKGSESSKSAIASSFDSGLGTAGALDTALTKAGRLVFPQIQSDSMSLRVNKDKYDAIKADSASTDKTILMVVFNDANQNGRYDSSEPIVSSSYGSRARPNKGVKTSAETMDFAITTNLIVQMMSGPIFGFEAQNVGIKADCIIDDAGNMIGDCETPTPAPPGSGEEPGDEDCDGESPLTIDLNNDGFHVSSADQGVMYDIDNDGEKEQVAWFNANTDDALIVYDRDGDGVIAENGSELFGTNTPLKDGTLAANGFVALAEFDENNDGKIDAYDQKARLELKLWRDLNRNGKAEANELEYLMNRVKSIDLTHRGVYVDLGGGSVIKAESTVKMHDGSERNVSDIWFATK